MYQPEFKITNTILNNLTAIAEVRSIVERSRVLPERETILRRQAVGKMVHASTSIEGNLLAQYEVEKVLAGQTVRAEERQIIEVKNYEKALQKVWDLSQEKKTITVNDILTLHGLVTDGLVLEEKCGHFRPGPVYVANINKDKEEVIYTAPASKQVEPLVNELIQWINSGKTNILNPVISAALFHYQFVTIHPFTDGNGRMTRLLTQFHLAMYNYGFKRILVLEEFYNNNRQSYYKALDTGKNYSERQGADLTSWVEYFTIGFLKEAEKVKREIISMGFAKAVPENEQVFLDRGQIKVMDFLASMGKITSQDVMDFLNLPKRTAQAKLKLLTDKNLIKKEGKGPSTFYILNE